MSCGKVKQNTLMTHSGKREEEKPQKRRKEKGLPHQPGGAVCQGFAGENYARRASFSTVKRRSRLTLTGRWRQATFAGVFVFCTIDIIVACYIKLRNRNLTSEFRIR